MTVFKNERHAAQDAIGPTAFDRLYSAACDIDDRDRRIENRFIVIGAGRLTHRSGELLHFCEDWIDRDRKIIKIPYHENCWCRYCKERAEAFAAENEITAEKARELYWTPKTEGSARAIYYGFSERAIDTVETFADVVGELNMAQSTINRRVDRLADRAGIRSNLYPHALRATSAFYWAEQGLEAHYLQALFGWDDLRVARAYLQATGVQLRRRIESLHNVDSAPAEPTEPLPDPVDRMKEATGDSPSPDDLSQRSLDAFVA